jgi:hypothetical protein
MQFTFTRVIYILQAAALENSRAMWTGVFWSLNGAISWKIVKTVAMNMIAIILVSIIILYII